MKLPLYQCHKQVRAAKIGAIGYSAEHNCKTLELITDAPEAESPHAVLLTNVNADRAWLARNPALEIGGYFVEYADGYTSYSPAKAFEEGYTLWPDVAAAQRVTEEMKRLVTDLGGPEDIPLGRPATCLRVHDRVGRLVLELDEAGYTCARGVGYTVENRVPERIVSAAAGGINFEDLPTELEVVMLGDVELVDFGKSLKKGEWMTVRFLDVDGDTGHILWAMEEPKALRKRLAAEQSVLRCILFVGDQVHREEEPEPPEDYAMQAQALMQSGWFGRPEVRNAMASIEQNIGPPRSSAEACHSLIHRIGYHQLQTTPPAAIYLWAVDNGVVDGLPDCYRVSVTEEIEA